MNKETIRPLLVTELEKLKREETEVRQACGAMGVAWQAARLKRVQAELQLWLADRQWEREEKEEYLRSQEAQLSASPTTKP